MKNYLLKISGAGNRFLLADSRWFGNSPAPEWKALSLRTKKSFQDFLNLPGLSPAKRKIFMAELSPDKELALAEGLVVLRPPGLKNKRGNSARDESGEGRKSPLKNQSQTPSLICDFYNKDGSAAEMCGNAACCLAFYANDISLPLKSFQLGKETVRPLKGQEGKWGIFLKSPPMIKGDFPFKLHGRPGAFALVFAGAPHGVIECPLRGLSLESRPALKELAQSLRFKNPLSAKGMNVSFFQRLAPGRLKAVAYERGVEDFTLACGTGALAAAFAYLRKAEAKNLKAVSVSMPGGELTVQPGPPAALLSPVKKGF